MHFRKKSLKMFPTPRRTRGASKLCRVTSTFVKQAANQSFLRTLLKTRAVFLNVVYRKIPQNMDYFIWLSRPPTGLYGDSQGSQCISLGPEGLVGPLGHDFLATLHL